jgi:hypothetical protein
MACRQTDAILRYAGKLAGLYPQDAYQALLCDEIAYVIEENLIKLGPTFRMTGEEQKAAREALVNGSIPVSALAGAKAASSGRRVFRRRCAEHCRSARVCGCAR